MRLSGVFAPVPTPIDDRNAIDTAKLRAAFQRWVAGPLHGFVVLGSNGEAALLDEEESDLVIATAREHIPRDRRFIVGTGRESTRAAVQAARRAAQLGAEIVLVRTPGFYKSQMTTAAFVAHYRAVADASPVPVLLYNFTALTGVALQPEAVAVLAEHPNIVGMKESGSDLAHIERLLAVAPESFAVFVGSSAILHAALRAGAAGGILGLANVIPDACMRLYRAVVEGRHEDARMLQELIAPLGKLVGSVNGVAGLKHALRLVGCDVGVPRPPLLPISADAEAALRGALEKFREGVAA